MSVTRNGSCHCGAVKYTAEFADDTLRAARCNCSICAIKGAAMAYVPLAAVTVTEGEDVIATYQFNTMVAKHHLCPKCGIHLFHQARSAPEFYGINVATLEGVRVYEDFAEVNINDGVHHQKDFGGKVRSAGTLTFKPNPEGWDEDS